MQTSLFGILSSHLLPRLSRELLNMTGSFRSRRVIPTQMHYWLPLQNANISSASSRCGLSPPWLLSLSSFIIAGPADAHAFVTEKIIEKFNAFLNVFDNSSINVWYYTFTTIYPFVYLFICLFIY